MGNGYARLTHCFTSSSSSSGEDFHRRRRRRHLSSAVTSEPPDEGLGHSFCYLPPPSTSAAASQMVKVSSFEDLAALRSISGAAVSANSSAPPSTALLTDLSSAPAASFESSTSFASVPLQPLPRFSSSGAFSGPLQAADRGFMSGPLERSVGFMSGPLDQRAALFSGPLEKPLPSASSSFSAQLRRSLSHGLPRSRRVRSASAAATSMLRGLTKAIGRTISGGTESVVGPIKPLKGSDLFDVSGSVGGCNWPTSGSSGDGCRDTSDTSAMHWWDTPESQAGSSNLQWAQGKAGEDRVHVVVSEEHGWVFVGIYDGFNGPDATDFLLSNLYGAVHQELKGLLWEDKGASFVEPSYNLPTVSSGDDDYGPTSATTSDCLKEDAQIRIKRKRSTRGVAKKSVQDQRRWSTEWEKERSELDKRLNDQSGRTHSAGAVINHSQVLKALARALRKTEETFLDIADKMVTENPELALMGSCVLAMLMKGDDLYLMNVGDSRAILAQRAEDVWGSSGKLRQDLERINEESASDLRAYGGAIDGLANSAAIQLTMDHSTSVQEEVQRIRNEHRDDASAIVKDRVKGSLKVTRAFGAGFLKQPKWNDALLEMFMIDYVGTSPYITCSPFLCHHKLGPKDKFLILSSDGLYQYFTNEEVVAHVENFIASTPEGDPAQHLVEEVLFRAAKKAGMDFHELLEIPHGDRRRYHDDVSIIVISLEGQIWRSCV